MGPSADACPNKKIHRADKIETEAWEKLSGLLKDPERLRVGIERMHEEQRAALRGDPTRELNHWHGELEKIERRDMVRSCGLEIL